MRFPALFLCPSDLHSDHKYNHTSGIYIFPYIASFSEICLSALREYTEIYKSRKHILTKKACDVNIINPEYFFIFRKRILPTNSGYVLCDGDRAYNKSQILNSQNLASEEGDEKAEL